MAAITKRVAAPLLQKPRMQQGSTKKSAKRSKPSQQETPRRSTKIASKPVKGKTVEQQAVTLLLKKSGILPADTEATDEHQAKFAEQFMTPLPKDKIASLKEGLGINKANADMLQAVVNEAGCGDGDEPEP